MSKKPLVSIIIPFLNAAKFIEEAIESVFAQTYDNWELLLVDDGSVDGSTDIALGYAEQYPGKVRYLEHEGHENRGTVASRNLGIYHAKAKYIAFLDADDVWLPHKLEAQVNILESHPEAAMVYGPAQVWYSWTGNPEDSERDFVLELGVQPDTLVKPPKLLPLLLQGEALLPLPSVILVRREMIERIGGFDKAFNGMYQLYEDSAYSAKVCLKEFVFAAGECWIKYRQHSDSHTSFWMRKGEYHPEKLNSAELFFFNWLEEYLTKQGAKDVEVWQALRKALWPYRHPLLYRLLRAAQYLAQEAKWLLYRILVVMVRFKRSALGGSTGSIIASPNPIRIQATERFAVGVTTLSWTSVGTEVVEVHVGASDGPLFSRSEPSGSATTDRWVHDGMAFYLQDMSGKKPLTIANTLAAVKVKIISTVN